MKIVEPGGFCRGEFGQRIAWFKTNCRKDIYPVLYTNTILGFDPTNMNTHSSARNNAAKLKHLTGFPGLDLDNSAGVRKVFENLDQVPVGD